MNLNLDWQEKTLHDGRVIRKAAPSEAFWQLWNQHKRAIKKANFGVSQYKGEWSVVDWNDRADKLAVANAIAESQATVAPKSFNPPVPTGLNYLPFQIAGIKYLCEHNSILCADPMGAGKTIQVIGYFNVERPKTVLIVCPNTMKENWRRELQAWLVEPRKVEVVDSKSDAPKEIDIVIINYDLLKKHQAWILGRTFGAVIFDESDFIKSAKAERSIIALQVKAKKRIALSGTPIPNRPIELQTVAGYLDPKNYGNFFAFAKRYADAHKNDFGWDFSGSSNLDELREKLRTTILLRREKDAILPDLPQKRRQVLVLPPDNYRHVLAEERKVASLEEALEIIERGESVRFDEISRVRHETALAKVPDVLNHISDNVDAGEPAVVFCHHRDVAEAISGSLAKDHSVVTLHGGHSEAQRTAAIDDFQNGKARFFVGTIGAAGVGITLTRASLCIIAEGSFVPGQLDQAEDRLHRIGQQNSVLIQYLVVSGSIEARLTELVVQKKRISKQVLDKYVPALTKEEVTKIEETEKPKTLEEFADTLESVNPDELPKVDLRNLPSGSYAVPGGDTRLKVRVDNRAADTGKLAGWVFVSDASEYGARRVFGSGCSQSGSRKKYGAQRPTSASYEGEIVAELQKIVADHAAAAAAYGRLVGHCGFCNRRLEDQRSIERGVGPVCWKKYC